MFDLRKLTKQEQYKLLMTTVHEASVLDRGGYEPTSKLGELNLLGVRGFSNGKASSNTYQSFDDTIFLFGLTKKGDIVVEEFVASTDYGNARYSRTPEYPKLTGKPRKAQKGDALVNIGQSKYKIHYHATSRYPQRWSVANPYYKSGRHYRALRPLGDGGSHSFRDLDGDTIQDLNEIVPFMNEPSERNLTLNIHFSMPYDDGPRGFSYGCQTISGNNKENMYDWSRYQSFIKLIEEDYSIRRGGDNELAERETGRVNKEGGKDGKRWLIYTLVTGTFLAEVYEKSFGLSLPVAVDLGGEPTTSVTPQSLAALHQAQPRPPRLRRLLPGRPRKDVARRHPPLPRGERAGLRAAARTHHPGAALRGRPRGRPRGEPQLRGAASRARGGGFLHALPSPGTARPGGAGGAQRGGTGKKPLDWIWEPCARRARL